ncbi:MAG TPA: hypothetical protein VN416_08175 [Desulfomonilia bacterium]|nr:hypothetical protein [Desulfomonilia bacterium]
MASARLRFSARIREKVPLWIRVSGDTIEGKKKAKLLRPGSYEESVDFFLAAKFIGTTLYGLNSGTKNISRCMDFHLI